MAIPSAEKWAGISITALSSHSFESLAVVGRPYLKIMILLRDVSAYRSDCFCR